MLLQTFSWTFITCLTLWCWSWHSSIFWLPSHPVDKSVLKDTDWIIIIIIKDSKSSLKTEIGLPEPHENKEFDFNLLRMLALQYIHFTHLVCIIMYTPLISSDDRSTSLTHFWVSYVGGFPWLQTINGFKRGAQTLDKHRYLLGF